MPGELIAGKYKLVEVLGRGGMGVVFGAYHEMLDRRVALKVLAPEVLESPLAVSRFLNEARNVARIASEHVVQVLDVGLLEGGLPYMVMERLEGEDLGRLLGERAHLPVPATIDILLEATEGVAHAHAQGIIHRDLKPSNLFLARRADGSTIVKVLDFGISKLTRADASSGNVTSTSAILGSPLYMSPEQLRSAKSIDSRADIWSLGVIAYELLTKTVPFVGENLVEIFAAIQEREARPLFEARADVPPALDEVVRRCLQRRPADRYETVIALARALAPFATSRGMAAVTRMNERFGFGPPPSGPRASSSAPPAAGERGSEPARSHPSASGSRLPPTLAKEATSAPWASTREGGARSRGLVGTLLGVLVVVGALIAVSVPLRSRSRPLPASGFSDASPAREGATAAEIAAPSSHVVAPLGLGESSTADAAIVEPPRSAAPERPPVAPTPPNRPRRAAIGAAVPPSPVAAPSSSAAAPEPRPTVQASATAKSPLDMPIVR